MASVTSIRSCGDQENSQQAVRLKNGVQGRSFGPTKSGLATMHNVPLATPRRALGDVGNTLMTPGNMTKKSSLLKRNHQKNHLQSQTPGAKKMTLATPHGRALSKPIGSFSLKQISKKQPFQVRGDQSTSNNKSSALEKDYFKKENMIPFTDEEKPLPRGPAISTVLKNVSQLYRGCLQPVANPATRFETVAFEAGRNTSTRPETSKNDNSISVNKLTGISKIAICPFSYPFTILFVSDTECDWFRYDDYSDITSNVSSMCLEDVELPAIDIDLSDLGLP